MHQSFSNLLQFLFKFMHLILHFTIRCCFLCVCVVCTLHLFMCISFLYCFFFSICWVMYFLQRSENAKVKVKCSICNNHTLQQKAAHYTLYLLILRQFLRGFNVWQIFLCFFICSGL